MIIRNIRKEELGRKLRRRQGEKKTKMKPNTQNCQPGDIRATWKGGENSASTFIEFQFNLASPSPHPVVFVSSSERSSPQKFHPLLPYELNANSTQVSWCPVAPNDLMHIEEVLTQQQGKGPSLARTSLCLSSGGSDQFLYQNLKNSGIPFLGLLDQGYWHRDLRACTQYNVKQ